MKLGKEEKRALAAPKTGKRVKVKIATGGSSVISVRLPNDVLRELELEAEKQGVGITTYARIAIEEKLALSESANMKRMSHVLTTFVEQFKTI